MNPLYSQPQQNPKPQNQTFYSNSSQQTNFDPSLPTMRQMRLEFAQFDGGDPIEWLNKAEQFFDFYQVPEDRRLAIGTMHLTGKASDRWYMFQREFPQTWQGLTDMLMREFGGYNVSDYQSALGRMSQVGNVDNYMKQFTRLSRRVPGFSQQALLSFFVGGLKSDIRANVKALKPKTLYEACELAKIFEEKEMNQRAVHRTIQQLRMTSSHTSSSNRPSTTMSLHQQRPQAAIRTNGGLHNTGVSVNVGGSRRLTQADYQERRARNQCFFCDEIFRPGHNCRRGQGQLMVIEVLQEEIEMPDPTTDAGEDSATESEQEPEIHLQIMGGLDDNDTMQVKGVFDHKQIHVLIDTGASHNFIHPALLKKCKAQIRDIKPLKVKLASGALTQTRGEVTVELQLGKYVFSGDFYILPVSGCEVVLGSVWLKTLGDIVWNFETMKMQFGRNGVWYVLQGETKAQAMVIGCQTMKRLLRRETEAVMVQLSPLGLQKKQRHHIQKSNS
ncbi:PREDICTED: uncharacterized protein LOC101314761 [Fragaria vesca subsp. vesca]